MLEPHRTLQRLVMISSTAGAAMLVMILLTILGGLFSGATPFNRLPDLNTLILTTAGLLMSLVFVGTITIPRHPAVGSMPDHSARLTITGCLGNAAAACTMASLVAGFLELAGLWKRMAPHQNPLIEQGAPVWIWWPLLAISLLLWLYPRNRALGGPDFRAIARNVFWIAFTGLIVASSAALFHILRYDPVPGKYYGIPGFVVGRESPNEYGTYYAAIGGIVAAILGLCALIAIFLGASRNEKQATGG